MTVEEAAIRRKDDRIGTWPADLAIRVAAV